ncbi:MAG: lipoate--protein ligase family protein [Candidatus Omnitrophota bacterium]|jgi:lipoate-protein ligase A
MNKNWRLILDGKRDGYLNMAIDEALLSSYLASKVPTLRIYGWDKPFLSTGYNQDPKKILKPVNKIPFVRRLTGGAAILHDNEITYSITCSLEDLDLPREVKKSYEILCSFIKEFYKRLGLHAEFAKYLFYKNIGRYENFCFSSYEHFDFVINGKKIGGNAQRRKRNVIFQHGSIPQKIDFEVIENSIENVTALQDKTIYLDALLNKKTKFFELSGILKQSFEHIFNVEFIHQDFSQKEKEMSGYLLENKYSRKEWNFDRERNPLVSLGVNKF